MLPPRLVLVAVGLISHSLAGCSYGPFGQLQPTNCGTPYQFRHCPGHAHVAHVHAPEAPTGLLATPAY